MVIGPSGTVQGALGSATSVVIADVCGLDVARWEMHTVDWDAPADNARAADARVCSFIDDHHVQAVVVDEVAATLRDALASAGVAVFQRAGISPRAAAVSAATVLALVDRTP